MLKIRRFKMSDGQKIANIIRKAPLRLRQESRLKDSRLRWNINISDPVAKSTKRIGYSANVLRRTRMKGSLVVVDNNEIVGVIQKSRGNFANLYLTKKYYRKGVGAELMSTVEESCLKQIANKSIIRAPIAPIPIIKHKYNIPVGTHATMHQVKHRLIPLTRKTFFKK